MAEASVTVEVEVKAKTPEVNDNQQVDLDRIRALFTAECPRYEEFQAITPMVLELLDLVQDSTLLQDAQRAREEMAAQDPEDILPSTY